MRNRPNILLLFTDMQRHDTIGALGNPVIRTPALDRIAREGTAFTSAYSPSPVCVPARCSMHYGLYPMRTGCAENGVMMEDNGASLPAALGARGYRTHAIGKCHFTPDKFALRGFQSRETQEESDGDDDYRKFLADAGFDAYEPMGQRGEAYYLPQASHLPEKVHPTQWVGDRALEFIDRSASREEPWFLFASFIHPHPPFSPPRPWHKLYRGPLMPLPETTQDQEALLTSVNRIQNRYKYRDQGRDLNLLRVVKAYYYACISFVDWQIQRMIDALERSGALDDTVIIFSSDHGEFLGDFDCFGKRSMHDPSSRVPFLVRYPRRFAAGARCDAPVSLVDVMPTALAAAEIDASGFDLDGEDAARVAEGASQRKYVYSQWSSGSNAQYMAVCRDWKYFYSAADEKEFLFNRISDPREYRNAAGLPFFQETKQEMKQHLLGVLKEAVAADAYAETEGGLEWRRHEKVDWPLQSGDFGMFFKQTCVSDDPDASLLVQDGSDALLPASPGFDKYRSESVRSATERRC